MQDLRQAPAPPRRMERTFVDDRGAKHPRTSVRDIETLQMRTINPILDVNGLEQNRGSKPILS